MKLIEKVNNLLSDVDKTHRYSMSRIYGIYNEVFDTTEQPQSCASCLIRKVNQLRNWLSEQANAKKHTPKQTMSKKKK